MHFILFIIIYSISLFLSFLKIIRFGINVKQNTAFEHNLPVSHVAGKKTNSGCFVALMTEIVTLQMFKPIEITHARQFLFYKPAKSKFRNQKCFMAPSR